MWRADELVNAAAAGLARAADALRAEQAVRGLDSLDELGLHPILRAAFAEAGLGVASEWPYPGEPGRRPRHPSRLRCDLVLTPGPHVSLADPVAQLRQIDAAAGTLFEPLAAQIARQAHRSHAARTIPPDEAFWLEVKSVGQFCLTGGVLGPNLAYAAQMVQGPLVDLAKLAADPAIRFGGLLLVGFHADPSTASHDLAMLVHRCLDRELPVQSPSVRSFEIADLIGNGICTVALLPLSGRAGP